MLQYAISDGRRGETTAARMLRLREQARRLSAASVDYFQIRERDLDTAELEQIVRVVVTASAQTGSMKILVNDALDVALASGSAGIHLRSGDYSLTPQQVRSLAPAMIISCSCHSVAEVKRAAADGADLILFGPIFEKYFEGAVVSEGIGLAALSQAVAASAGVPVVALGGVTPENAGRCRTAGAAGIAGIRIFLS